MMANSPSIGIAPALMPEDIGIVRGLFTEYVAALAVDLSFQDVENEFAELPGRYSAPAGTILIARDFAGNPVGCCALRPLPERGLCEMKRLYVRPEARGRDLGRRLVEAIIAHARGAPYSRIVLDTSASMHAAQRLYASLGFRSIAPYNSNPLPDALYLGLDL